MIVNKPANDLGEKIEKIKSVNWSVISKDWKIKRKKCKNCEEDTYKLNPYEDCSKDNPLYLYKDWLDYLYSYLEFSDREISEICGISVRQINRLRAKFGITTKEKNQITARGYIEILMPIGYNPPFLKPQTTSGRVYRGEHIIIMENYLKDNPELVLSKNNLVEEKYLRSECVLHHINYNKIDNRIENLCLFENQSEHGNLQRSLNHSFSKLIKLNQICFAKGKYYINKSFDYQSLTQTSIEDKIKVAEFLDYEDLNVVREELKKINWKEISNNWVIEHKYRDKIVNNFIVDPCLDCSKENPLYKHKKWVERIIKDKNFNMTDHRLAKLCNISYTQVYRWRWEKHRISNKDRQGKHRYLVQKQNTPRILIKIPDNYMNPYAMKQNRQKLMYEHRFVMERYLTNHPDWEISKNCLLKGKYLKPEYIVHHINLDSIDNRIENLWITTEHNKVHKNLITLIEPLLNEGLLIFQDGRYILDC